GESPPLLFLLLRQAMLQEYARTALEILIQHGLATEADRREAELIGIPLGPAGVVHQPIWQRFAALVPSLPTGQPLGDILRAGGRAETRATDDYRTVLQQLQSLPGAELERLFTE